jgi:YbbR domain-containing protein
MSTRGSKRRYHILAGSFLVAAAFWFSVTMGNLYRSQVDIPLTVTAVPRDIALTSPLPATISVLVEASGWQLLFLTAGKPVAFEIPAEALRRGMIVTNRVLAEMIKLPAGVTAIRAYPDTLHFSVDRLTEKKVPLRVGKLSVSFKEGFGLMRAISIEPDSVHLHGAESVLDDIDSWSIEARTYNDLAIPVVDDVPLMDSLSGVVRLAIDKTRLYIPTEQLAEMHFEDIPIQIRDKPEGGEVLLGNKTVTLLVRGGVNVLANLSPEDFRVQIDYDELLADSSGTVIPTIVLPSGLHLLKVDPPELRYSLRK